VLGRWTLDNSLFFITAAMDMMSRVFSPYDFNSGGTNPLRKILGKLIDIDRLKNATIKFFVRTTCVCPGRVRMFPNNEITPDVLLAAPACRLFQAVEIGGESYWDGDNCGYPTMTPLVRECNSKNTIIVRLNRIERPGTPAMPAMSSIASTRFHSKPCC
jgi:NTE family protein